MFVSQLKSLTPERFALARNGMIHPTGQGRQGGMAWTDEHRTKLSAGRDRRSEQSDRHGMSAGSRRWIPEANPGGHEPHRLELHPGPPGRPAA